MKVFRFCLSSMQFVLVFFVASVAVVSFSGQIPLFSQHGLILSAVSSGSMSPTLPTGSLIYSVPYIQTKPKTGDIVTYSLDSEGTNVPLITHRIIGVLPHPLVDGEEHYSYQTKGDANSAPDSILVEERQILGRMILMIPYLGFITLFVHQPLGFLSCLVLPTIVSFFWEVRSLINQVAQFIEKKQTRFGQTKKSRAIT